MEVEAETVGEVDGDGVGDGVGVAVDEDPLHEAMVMATTNAIHSLVIRRTIHPTDEDRHREATALLGDPDLGLITGTWTRIEVSGALVRAARSGRGDETGLLSLLDADLAIDGPVAVVVAAQAEVEIHALGLVRELALRAMDAWHLATALLTCSRLVEPHEKAGFATRDQREAEVAASLGLGSPRRG